MDPDHCLLRFGGIAERVFSPAVTLAQDLRGHSKARHRPVRCENDHCAASFARGAGEPHRFRALGLDAGDHYKRESSAAKKLLRPTESVLSIARAHEDRSLFPEWTGDGGVTRGPQHCCRSPLRHPDSEPSTRETASGKNCIEYLDARRHRFGGPVSDRCRIWKSMLDERANGGVTVGHSPARIARRNTESKENAALE